MINYFLNYNGIGQFFCSGGNINAFIFRVVNNFIFCIVCISSLVEDYRSMTFICFNTTRGSNRIISRGLLILSPVFLFI